MLYAFSSWNNHCNGVLFRVCQTPTRTDKVYFSLHYSTQLSDMVCFFIHGLSVPGVWSGIYYRPWSIILRRLIIYILLSLLYQTTVSDHLYFPVHCLSDYSDRPNIFWRSGSITLRCLIRYLPIDNVPDSSDCYLYFYSSTTLYIIIYIPCFYFCLVGWILIA